MYLPKKLYKMMHSMMIRDKRKNRDSKDDSKKDLVSAKNPEAYISDVSTQKGRVKGTSPCRVTKQA